MGDRIWYNNRTKELDAGPDKARTETFKDYIPRNETAKPDSWGETGQNLFDAWIAKGEEPMEALKNTLEAMLGEKRA